MSPEIILFSCAIVFGFYMAWNIGANDVANAMGTSVGSGALTLKRAVLVAAVLEFAGAYLAGSDVSETVMRGILYTDQFSDAPQPLVLGMLAALLAAGSWLQTASYFGWPVSTTHSIIGAVVGFGCVYGGFGAVQWMQVGYIVMSWVISPLMGGVLSFFFFTFLSKKIFYKPNPIHAAKSFAPVIVFGALNVFFIFLVTKALKNFQFHISSIQLLGMSIAVSSFGAVVSYYLIGRAARRFKKKPLELHYDPKISTSLDKAIKHLRKARMQSADEMRFQIDLLVQQSKALSKTAQMRSESDVDPHEYQAVEKIFAFLQIISASLMAFAHGANDVANAIGPLAAIVHVLETGTIATEALVPPWVLALGGVGIIIGLATWGWRVIATIGRGITELTPSRGFAAELGAATTILLASKLGLPISTTHTLVGGVLGVGLARGIGAINMGTVRDIIASWLITVPAGAVLAIGFFTILMELF